MGLQAEGQQRQSLPYGIGFAGNVKGHRIDRQQSATSRFTKSDEISVRHRHHHLKDANDCCCCKGRRLRVLGVHLMPEFY